MGSCCKYRDERETDDVSEETDVRNPVGGAGNADTGRGVEEEADEEEDEFSEVGAKSCGLDIDRDLEIDEAMEDVDVDVDIIESLLVVEDVDAPSPWVVSMAPV
ncbi:hypothetical protein BGX28_006897 [Mortierella sp. GBA30]|nr:hypothetical protein BGX28_006897 [Mortierella sp. GBA30]